ncbi:hypothetical protein [Streptococcus fryi]
MREREWIKKFIIINHRQPNDFEIKEAFFNQEFKKSYWLSFRRLVIWKQIFIVCLVAMIVLVSYQSSMTLYQKFQVTRNRRIYYTIINDYQKGIIDKDDDRIPPELFEQPTRNPSYIIEDLDEDGREELYIGFDDGEETVEIVKQYDISFGMVQEFVPMSHLNRLLKGKKWTRFDVVSLSPINLEELSVKNFSTVIDTWVTKDRLFEVDINDSGIDSINGINTITSPNDKEQTDSIVQVYQDYAVGDIRGGKISLTALTNLGIHYTYTFIPEGIKYKETDLKLDRLVVSTFDGEKILYRFSDIFEVESEKDSGNDQSDYIKKYQKVIDDNLEMLSSNSFYGLEYYSPEALNADELYYALYDFDSNGIDEFILAGKTVDSYTGTTFEKLAIWERTIYGIFTLKDNEIVTLFNGTGYRTHVVPMADGSFWLRASGGYDTGVYEHYVLNKSGTEAIKDLIITYENLGKTDELIVASSGDIHTWQEVKLEINRYDILSSNSMEWNRL